MLVVLNQLLLCELLLLLYVHLLVLLRIRILIPLWLLVRSSCGVV